MIRLVGSWDLSCDSTDFSDFPQKKSCPLVRIFIARRLFQGAKVKCEETQSCILEEIGHGKERQDYQEAQ